LTNIAITVIIVVSIINCEVVYLAEIHFYKNSAGTNVALWPGKCKNTPEGPRKEGQLYLGTVIDREKLIFCLCDYFGVMPSQSIG
jgi:hypothetical protein